MSESCLPAEAAPAVSHPEPIALPSEAQDVHWYVLRDLRRPNARTRSWEELTALGFDVFTPLKWVTSGSGLRRERRQVPVISDLLFVRSSREALDVEVNRSHTLQYRYERGRQSSPMVVRPSDMDRFISAVRSAADTRYYLPEELSPSMYGRRIRIVGGPLDGSEGHLLRLRGSRVKRLLVELPSFLTAAVEVTPEYIQLL